MTPDSFPIAPFDGIKPLSIPCPPSIPWSMIADQQRWARTNYELSLEQLAQHGGLTPTDLYYVLRGEYGTEGGVTPEEAIRYIEMRLGEFA